MDPGDRRGFAVVAGLQGTVRKDIAQTGTGDGRHCAASDAYDTSRMARNPRISEDSGFPGRQDARRRNPESRGGKRSGGSGTPCRLRPGKPRKAFLQAENDRKSTRHGSARNQRNNCFSGRCGLSAEAAGRECPKAASRGTATDSDRTTRSGGGLRTSGDRAHGLCNDHAGFDRFGRQPVRREPDGRGAGGRNSRGFRSAQGRDLRRDTQTEIRRITVPDNLDKGQRKRPDDSVSEPDESEPGMEICERSG